MGSEDGHDQKPRNLRRRLQSAAVAATTLLLQTLPPSIAFADQIARARTAATTVRRDEGDEQPSPLVLRPADEGPKYELAHRSHSSHSSHRSHSSHYSGSGGGSRGGGYYYVPEPTPPSPPPQPKPTPPSAPPQPQKRRGPVTHLQPNEQYVVRMKDSRKFTGYVKEDGKEYVIRTTQKVLRVTKIDVLRIDYTD